MYDFRVSETGRCVEECDETHFARLAPPVGKRVDRYAVMIAFKAVRFTNHSQRVPLVFGYGQITDGIPTACLLFINNFGQGQLVVDCVDRQCEKVFGILCPKHDAGHLLKRTGVDPQSG